MRHELNFWVLGGDMRQGKLAQLLAEDGHRVHTYALEDGVVPAPGLTAEPGLSGVEQADCVVLPLPVSSGGGLLNAPLSRLSLWRFNVGAGSAESESTYQRLQSERH